MSNIQIGDYVHIISGHCGCSRGYVTFIERWKGNIQYRVCGLWWFENEIKKVE